MYGFVDRDAGSVASANWLLIDALLTRGHHVDLFAIDGFIRPREFEGRPGYRYFRSKVSWAPAMWAIANRSPRRVKSTVMTACSWTVNPFHLIQLRKMIARRHAVDAYDAFVAVGLGAPFTVAGLPTISWPQGPTSGEAKGVRSQHDNIIRYEGRVKYALLECLYARRLRNAQRELGRGDTLICGSEWSRDEWVAMGADPRRTFAIPYPYDLSLYRPKRPVPLGSRPVQFVWLGRVVPRKRLDLAINALRIVRQSHDARLKIVGGFSYVPRFRRMLDEADLGDALQYDPWVDRAQTPALLQQADALLQPSEYENLGSGPLEALACGTPVILGPTNGTRDYVCRNSIIFTDYTAESVASAMREMIERLRRIDAPSLIAEARRAAESSVNIDRVVGQVEQVIRSVAGAGRIVHAER